MQTAAILRRQTREPATITHDGGPDGGLVRDLADYDRAFGLDGQIDAGLDGQVA